LGTDDFFQYGPFQFVIPAGAVTHELAVTFDLLPTFAKLIGAELPAERIIDGKDIAPLIFAAPGAKTPHDVFYYYWGKQLHAVQSPLLPPVLETRRTPSMTMPFSAAFSMS